MDTRKDETVSKNTFLQKIIHIDKATLFFNISIALMTIVIIWVIYLTISVSNLKGTRVVPEILAIVTSIISIIIALLTTFYTTRYDSRTTNAQIQSLLSKRARESLLTLDIPKRLERARESLLTLDIPKQLDRTSKRARESLLTLQTKQFDLQKQKTELYEERSSLLWQEDALEVLEASPQAAILVSWIGVEQTLSRFATKLTLSDSLLDRRVIPLLVIESLSQSGYISEDETRLLKQMQEKRNRAVHGIEEEGGKIAIEQAVDYIQNAININSRLTLLQKREVLTKEEIA